MGLWATEGDWDGVLRRSVTGEGESELKLSGEIMTFKLQNQKGDVEGWDVVQSVKCLL